MEWLGSAIPDPIAKFPVLISYAYLLNTKPETIDWLMNNPKIELIIDSGAFTALNAGKEIDLIEYMEFLKKYQSKLFGYFALDKLGDPAMTEKNFAIMLDNGLKPIPIHVRGDDRKRMDYLFKQSDWVGCGGFRRPHRGPAPKSYVMEKMRWANGRDVHWLGYTTTTMLKTFKPYSCDCSSWTSPLQYGNLRLYLGAGQWSKALKPADFNKVSVDPKIMAVLDRCGFTLKDARNEKRWRTDTKGDDPGYHKFLPLQTSLYSWTRYIRDFRSKVGTRIFMAIAALQYAPHMYRWIDATDPTGSDPYVR